MIVNYFKKYLYKINYGNSFVRLECKIDEIYF